MKESRFEGFEALIQRDFFLNINSLLKKVVEDFDTDDEEISNPIFKANENQEESDEVKEIHRLFTR